LSAAAATATATMPQISHLCLRIILTSGRIELGKGWYY
jgi:hypothetical protein